MAPFRRQGKAERADLDKFDRIELEAYETERLSGLVVENVRRLMKENDLRPSELALRLGVSEARVSQMLSTGTNLTLRSLAALSVALGAQFDLQLLPVVSELAESSHGGLYSAAQKIFMGAHDVHPLVPIEYDDIATSERST